MKKVTLLIALLFILSACQSRTPAPAEVLPTPSRTPSPTVTPTPNATERYQGTLQANQTQNAGYALTQGAKGTSMALTRTAQPTATLTPTITPTAFPSPTPTPLPVTNYRLSNPDQNTLIQLMMNVIEERSDDPFVRVLDYEWERNFANMDSSLFSLDSLPKEDEQEEKYFWFYPSRPESFYDFLAVITTNFINQKALHLKNLNPIVAEGFKVQPYLVEIDGDAEPEWLVYSDFRDISTSVWLTLDQIGEGQYRQLQSEIRGTAGGYTLSKELSRLEDFTGDGLSDVVIVESAYFGGGADMLFFEFLYGSPDGFKLIYQVNEGNNSPYDDTSYEWVTLDEKEPVLRIINDQYNGWCREFTYREFNWEKSGVQEIPVSNLPLNAACAIGRTVNDSLDNQTIIYWLETALKMEEMTPQLAPEDIIYAHYKLAMAYALEENNVLTKMHLNFIIELASSKQIPIAVNLASQITPLLAENRILPYRLCEAAENLALPIAIVNLLYYVYPYEGYQNGYPTPICESSKFQEAVLHENELRSSQFTKTTLESLGFSVIEFKEIQLGLPSMSWVVLLKSQTSPIMIDEGVIQKDQNIAYLYSQEIGWEPLGQFSPDYEIEWLNEDVNGDGQYEFASLQQNGGSICETEQLGYGLNLLTNIGHNWIIFAKDSFLCQPASQNLSLSAMLQDKNDDGEIDWLVDDYFADYDLGLLANYPPPTPSIFDWWKELSPLIYKPDLLTSLDDQFFTSPTPSLLRPDLEFYRARWGTGDDPASEQIYAHLTYLLALTYELEGNEPQAVELFYDLWANHPDTLWAYLAASRLALKP